MKSQEIRKDEETGKEFPAYNLFLSMHCTDCDDPQRKHDECLTKSQMIDPMKPGYFRFDDFETPKGEPRNAIVPWMCEFECFLYKVLPEDKMPHVELWGNFCLLARNEEKNREKNKGKGLDDPLDIPVDDMTTQHVVSNMARGGRPSNLWQFLDGLENEPRKHGNPPVDVFGVDQAWHKDPLDEDYQEKHLFRVRITFSPVIEEPSKEKVSTGVE